MCVLAQLLSPGRAVDFFGELRTPALAPTAGVVLYNVGDGYDGRRVQLRCTFAGTATVPNQKCIQMGMRRSKSTIRGTCSVNQTLLVVTNFCKRLPALLYFS